MSKISTTLIARKTSKNRDERAVYFNIRVSGFNAYRIASGISVPTRNFTKGSIVGSGKQMVLVRKRLESMIQKIEEAHYHFIENNQVPDPRLLLQYISNQSEEAITILKLADLVIELKEKDFKAGNCTYHLPEKFRTLKEQLELFITQELVKNDLFLAEVNFNFVNRFRYYLQTSLSNNNVTVNKKMANLGQLFKYAIKNDWMTKNPVTDLKKLEEEKTNNEFFTEEELKQIMAFELPNETHEVIRDSFVFMAFTGMAISDMKKFCYKDIILKNGQEMLTYSRKKTGNTVHLPINAVLANLINKHYSKPFDDKSLKRKRPKNDSDPVFSAPAEQVYNRKLKNLFEYNELYKDFSITAHCARKTFGNMVHGQLGVDVASQLLGHSSIAVTEKNYIDNHNLELGIKRGNLLNEYIDQIFKDS
jgi:integrase